MYIYVYIYEYVYIDQHLNNITLFYAKQCGLGSRDHYRATNDAHHTHYLAIYHTLLRKMVNNHVK